MKKLLIILSVISTLSSSAQCFDTAKVACSDTTTYPYFIIPSNFVNKYQNYKKGYTEFVAAQTLSGCWVTAYNSINEFPELFKEYNLTKLNAQYTRLNRCNFYADTTINTGGGTVTPTGGTVSATLNTKKTNGLSALTLSSFLILLVFYKRKQV